MKTLKCMDMDPSSTCDHVATGADDMEVMANMKAHVATDHADKVAIVTDEMMTPHIKNEEVATEEAPAM